MPKQTIVIEGGVHLSLKNKMLCIQYNDTPDETIFRPIDDIGYVIIDNIHCHMTIPVIEKLNQNNIPISICNLKHLPVSVIIPLYSNAKCEEIFRKQVEMTAPQKKQAWKQIVSAKIGNQAALLGKIGKRNNHLLLMMKNIVSGDKNNKEAMAAKIYWKELFGKDFVRLRSMEAPNSYLNYGYTILRTAMIKAIICSGLCPLASLFHKNYYDQFPLADDLMEPYRPFIDEVACHLNSNDNNGLNRETKHKLIDILYSEIRIKNISTTIITGISITATSYVNYLKGETKKIELPVLQ